MIIMIFNHPDYGKDHHRYCRSRLRINMVQLLRTCKQTHTHSARCYMNDGLSWLMGNCFDVHHEYQHDNDDHDNYDGKKVININKKRQFKQSILLKL